MVIRPFQDNISFQKPLCYTKSAALRLPLFSVAPTAVCSLPFKVSGIFLSHTSDVVFVSLPYIYKQKKKKTINYGKD